MAVVHVRPGGTKAATGGGDYASTEDDWSLANCYDNLLQVGRNNQSGSPADYIAAGDEIILYSTEGVETIHTLPNSTSLNNVDPGGQVKVKSRTGNADECILNCSENNTQFQINISTTETAFRFEDITFDSQGVTYSDANEPILYFRGECGDLYFKGVKFRNFTMDAPGNNNGLTAYFYSRFTGTLKDRDVTFEDCTADNLVMSCENGGYFFRIDGASASSESGNLTFKGD